MNKAQRLGGGGSAAILKVVTDENATVKITKGDIFKETSAVDGVAIFKNVSNGIWNILSSLDGANTTDSVEITNEFIKKVPVGLKLKDMPIKQTKIKLPDGTKCIFFKKDHPNYAQGALTLITEYLVGSLTSFGSSVNYAQSTPKKISEDFYNKMTDRIKELVLPTTRKIKNGSGQYIQFTENFYILNSAEVGGTTDTQMGSNLGFANDTERICYNAPGGTAQPWWLADAIDSDNVRRVSSGGIVNDNRPSTSYGVRLACNLSPSTIITSNTDSEGYYSIK